MAKKEIEIGQKCAFIRDNALVLYFDKAETPFVARYDLDSLAQANFEVTDKKDGLFTLSLRDYSGRSQEVGQFGNKADAHQALYTILQALLEHNGQQSNGRTCKLFSVCGIGCMLLKLLKWVLLTIGVLVVLYVILGLIRMPSISVVGSQGNVVGQTAPQNNADTARDTATGLSALPEGEAVDADALFAPSAADDEQAVQDNADDEQNSGDDAGASK